jgi:chromate transporter
MIDVFLAFLRLGLTSFGGPVAHLGYFRAEFVQRRRWLSEPDYAAVVALCQVLPGPASSQTGFAIGLMRAGLGGGLAAFAGFTLPSFLLMVAVARGLGTLWSSAAGAAALHGLQLVAVGVVAQAVWGMGRTACTGRAAPAIAFGAACLAWGAPGWLGPVAAIVFGAGCGLAVWRDEVAGPVFVEPDRARWPARGGVVCLVAFAVLLCGALVVRGLSWPGVAGAFFRAGALVFGGGHVVLPMLRDVVVTPFWVDPQRFLSGYGAAQALPGPLFSFAAYLGALLPAPFGGMAGASVAMLAIFAPGLLLVSGALPFWHGLSRHPRLACALRGINAAVVGLLAAALYDPVWTGAVRTRWDAALAAAAFLLLTVWRVPSWAVVMAGVAAGVTVGWGLA